MKVNTCILVCFFLTKLMNAQTWRSEYYPVSWTPPVTSNFYTDAFLQDFSYAGYARGEKTIPKPSLKIFDVSKAPYNADRTGLVDATSAIRQAIADAQTNNSGVIYLPSGTYLVHPEANNFALEITKSNVSIKGDGIGKTFVLNTSYEMTNRTVISFSGSGSWTVTSATTALLTADVMSPTNVIPVNNPALFAIGDLVMVRNYISDDWINEHKEISWLGYGAALQGLQYCRYITSIDPVNKKITLDVPLRYALKIRDGACVYKLKGMISEVGISDLSIGNVQHPGTTGWGENDFSISGTSANDCHGANMIQCNLIVNSWIQNVSTYTPPGNTSGTQFLSNGILVTDSKNISIDNCSFSHAQYGGGGGNGYAYRISANEVLVSNSMANYCRHGFVFSGMNASGNVIFACKDIKTGIHCINTGGSRTAGWGSDHHMHFSQSNLIDNSYSENSAFVAFYRPYGTIPKHNLTSVHSAFWNIISGGGKDYCIWTQQARYGYAIGTSGVGGAIVTKENSPGGAAITDPVDVVEGEGMGASLQPQSLYLDQLKRRLLVRSTVNPNKVK
jgi:hypothetical protein